MLNQYGTRHFKKFYGVWPSDMIPKGSNGGMAILNSSSDKEPGQHWVPIMYENGNIYMHDSYDRRPYTVSHNFRNFIGLGNGRPEQKTRPYETNCGARSLATLHIFSKYGLEGVNKL